MPAYRASPTSHTPPRALAERSGEEWRIALFQSTPAQYHGRPEAVEEHTAEIEHVRAADETVG